MLRRWLRTVPLYWFCLVVMAVLWPPDQQAVQHALALYGSFAQNLFWLMQAVTEPVAHQSPSPPAATRDAGFGVYLYVPSLYEVSTDDAYVDAHVVSVVPKVAAYVAALHVDDNTTFAAGTLLVELDPRDFQVAVDTADADRVPVPMPQTSMRR